jgi:hypothetical protein
MAGRRTAVVALGLLAGSLAIGAARAHPGSGIGIDRQGRIFFVDTGQGVWMIDAAGALHPQEGPAFHWMALDPWSAFGATPLPRLPSTDMRAVGSDPMVILASDYPIAVGRDGALYLPEPGRDRRLHLVRLLPSGERSDLAVLPAKSDGAPLQWLNGVAAAPDGSIYYSENAAVRRIDAHGVRTTVAAGIVVPGCDRLPGAPAELGPLLRGLAVTEDGAVYVAASACRVVLRIGVDGEVEAVLRAEAPWAPTGVALHGSDVYALEYTHTADEEPRDRRVWVPRVRRLATDGSVAVIAVVER